MGKLKTFEILVDDNGTKVKPGQSVRGQVHLELREDIRVNGSSRPHRGMPGPTLEIRISFMGHCRVQWAEVQNKDPLVKVQSATLDPVVAEETYVDETTVLFPNTPTGLVKARRDCHGIVLTEGTHLFDFRFALPATAPSSFSGNHGYVRYTLQAVVERPWKMSSNTRNLCVEADLDLGDVLGARDSVDVSDFVPVNTLLVHSGDCYANMRLSRRGFMPGEVVPIEFCIFNNSLHEIHKVSLHLRKVVTYKCGRRKCTREVMLFKSVLGKVPAGKTFEGTYRRLKLPLNCQPTGLPGCRHISIKYILELKVKPTVLSLKRLKLISPIIVGTKGISLFYDNPPDYDSCCPPSYEDVLAVSLPPPPPPPTPPPAEQPSSCSAASSCSCSASPRRPLSPSPTDPCPGYEEAISSSPPHQPSLLLRTSSSQQLVDSRLRNDDLRVTVLRQDEDNLDLPSPGGVRPRAHTTSGYDMTRNRGSLLTAGNGDEEDRQRLLAQSSESIPSLA